MATTILSRRRRAPQDLVPVAPRVVAYARVSTAEQSTNGVSLDEQERRIRAHCMAEDWPLTEMFVERGISGSMPLRDRPIGRQLLRMLRLGDVLIAAKLDRLFRSARDALDQLAAFKKVGIRVYCLDLGRDDVNANGISTLLTTILAAVAEFERARIAERIRDAKAQLRFEGKHQGGSRPFGWRFGPPAGRGNGPTLVADEIEQAAIADMAAMRAHGASLMQVRDAMRERGFPISHETVRRALGRAAATERMAA